MCDAVTGSVAGDELARPVRASKEGTYGISASDGPGLQEKPLKCGSRGVSIDRH